LGIFARSPERKKIIKIPNKKINKKKKKKKFASSSLAASYN
jgi:hypothetical protein